MLLLPGDHFVVRSFSPVTTIGGGVVIDGANRSRMRDIAQRASQLERGSASFRVELYARELSFLSRDELGLRTGWSDQEIDEAVTGAHVFSFHGFICDPGWVRKTLDDWLRRVRDFHAQHPFEPGLPKESLRSKRLAGVRSGLFDALLERERRLLVEHAVVKLAGFRASDTQSDEHLLGRIEQAFAASGLSSPTAEEALRQAGIPRSKGEPMLRLLVRQGRLVQVSTELTCHPRVLADLKELLGRRKGQRFSVPEFKEWTGVSRKYAVPFLEYLDRQRVTRREGNLRLVL
jgi:selenocysteine-specific elongation factor